MENFFLEKSALNGFYGTPSQPFVLSSDIFIGNSLISIVPPATYSDLGIDIRNRDFPLWVKVENPEYMFFEETHSFPIWEYHPHRQTERRNIYRSRRTFFILGRTIPPIVSFEGRQNFIDRREANSRSLRKGNFGEIKRILSRMNRTIYPQSSISKYGNIRKLV